MVPSRQTLFKAFILTTFIFTTHSAPEFPKLSDIELEFYQTDVQVTNIDQKLSAFATEYYDDAGGPRGRVDVLSLGNKLSIFYNNDTNQILEVNTTTCQASDIGDSLYDYEPIFYGWLNKNPLIIGPTAPIWYANTKREEVKSLGEAEVRSIMCDKYSIDYLGARDNVTFYYYFAAQDWTTPYQIKGFRVPIRIEVRGISSKSSAAADQWMPINQITDFSYFRPTISDWRIFQPPVGIGCPTKKVTRELPKFPKVYRYSAEVVDLIKAEKEEVSDIEYHQVWYDGTEKLARLDKYTRMRSISELYDFNTGVTYSNVDGSTCSILPLRNSFFESYDGKMIGHLKEPGEVLNLDGTFYYMGNKLIRGIWTDVFESVSLDVTFMNKKLSKLVVTAYYSQAYYEVIVNGESETRVPVFYAVKGWGTPTTVAINLQYNIFGFDDVIYPDMYASFRLGRCFPSMQDKSYFIMVLAVEKEMAATMEAQDDFIMEQMRREITKYAKVSNLRIPMLRADYKTQGVFITGLLLDRPPALKQFWLEYEGEASTTDPYLKVAPAADTKEKCAFACVDEEDFTCTGFYFCEQACFIKSKDILEPSDDSDNNYEMGNNCQEWLRAERNSNNKEAYLKDALQSLEEAVLNSTVRITVQLDDKSNPLVPVTDIIIGDGPYTGEGNQEKPYNLVITFAKLISTDETTEDLEYIDSLNDCYKACKNSEDLSCSSFSYCPDASNKQCKISSMLVVDRKNNPDDTEDDKNCYVYSLKYLDFYTAYPGTVALIPGADVFTDVKTNEECAKRCRQAKDIACRGFEFCQSTKNCVLHTKHVLDLKPGEVITSKKKTSCIHYAARYSADYYDMGYYLVDDKSDVRTELSLEKCAEICSEELKDKCLSFNYCPASGPYMTDSTCALSPLTLTSPRKTTTKTPPCHHYEKKDKVDDWGRPVKRTKTTTTVTSGYTSSGFTWLVIGMLILGFALGAVGFVVYSYFKSKSSGAGMTVRFMKQDNI